MNPVIVYQTDNESDAARACDGFNRTAPPGTSYSMHKLMPAGIFAVARLRHLPASFNHRRQNQ